VPVLGWSHTHFTPQGIFSPVSLPSWTQMMNKYLASPSDGVSISGNTFHLLYYLVYQLLSQGICNQNNTIFYPSLFLLGLALASWDLLTD